MWYVSLEQEVIKLTVNSHPPHEMAKKKSKLDQAKKIIRKLIKCGVEVDERVKDKKWMLESNPYFFGCEGSSYVGIADILEIGEMYEDQLNQ